MKYLCLICADKVMEQMSDSEATQQYQEYTTFTDNIKNSGHFVSGNRLLPPDCATTIRVRDSKILISDGPFAETKEQFGGYYVIEATDLDEAIRVAAQIPGAQYGCVEIRPIADDPQTRALGLD